jgi:MFS family permease
MSRAAVCSADVIEVPEIARRSPASRRALLVFGVAAAITLFASSSAPTPLYRLYQEQLGLSPLLLTVIFASYAFSLLGALLTVGSLSDYVGRRPVAFAALVLNMLAMGMFVEAHSAGMLIAARVVQGFAVGAATTTLGAVILDADRARGPLFNTITIFAGLTIGVLGSSALATTVQQPEQVVYVVMFIALVLLAIVLWQMPETAERRQGALGSLRPHVSVPPQALSTLVRLTPVNIAAWALGGFYLSLMPSLVRVATGFTSPIVGGVVVAAFMGAAGLAAVASRTTPATRVVEIGTVLLVLGVAVTLAGVQQQVVSLLLLGTIIAGLGEGLACAGPLRTVLPLAAPDERAGLLSAFYVECYLAYSLPTILIGMLVPVVGLPVSTYIYGTAVLVVAISSLIVTRISARSV